MGYKKKQYYEDDFVMNHFERLSDDFGFVDGADHVNFSAAIATITFTGICTADETITIIAADGTSKTFTAKSSSPSAAAGTFANAFASNANASGLGDCLTNAAGLQGKINVSRSGPVLTLTQVIEGSHGNTTITSNLSNVSITGFTGGAGIVLVPFSYATKGVRLRLNPDAYKTNLG
tara:strand:- start:472 stop:1002 length:531 start_codon:yes stop_codon:yes gene_type:complete